MKLNWNVFLLTIILSMLFSSCSAPQPKSTTTTAQIISQVSPIIPSKILKPTYTPTQYLTSISTLTPTNILQPTLTLTPLPKGKTIVVSSIDDSGPGTLRQAILDSQVGDEITFNINVFPPEKPTTIFLKNEDQDSALPGLVRGGLTIDASDAGVILDGRNLIGDWVNGIEIISNGNSIQGLQIINFSGAGIVIWDASYNMIGGDRSIGAGIIGRGNLISKNGFGIQLCCNGANNRITGNIIGSDDAIKNDWGNIMNGIMISGDMINNTIGPENIIVHNGSIGILIHSPSTFGNTITQNSIFDNAYGIRLDGGNTKLAYPVIVESDISAGTISGTSCPNCTIEIFSTNSNEGDIFEGKTKADSLGVFSYDNGNPFAGPYLSVTATDAEGNTSEMGLEPVLLQEGNNNPTFKLQPMLSSELEDNRIGIHFNDLWKLEPEVFPDGELKAEHILSLGVKRARFAINNLDWENIHWDKPESIIEPSHDQFISTLAENGITLTYVLSFWDKEYKANGGNLSYPRFKTEDQIQRYLDYVQFIVHHIKDRVKYFEIWNEPSARPSIQTIEVKDYINLVKRVVPVIRQEYPEAKIVVGGVSNIFFQDQYYYLLGILGSNEIMPLVDAISWHGMYGPSPESDFYGQYYYNYPSIVRKFKETASAHGFNGEFVSDELVWWTQATSGNPEISCSETICAKYYARGIVMHLGLDVSVSQFYTVPNTHPKLIVDTIRNLSTAMAGAMPTESLSIKIDSQVENVQSFVFLKSNGDFLVTLWTDGVAVDYDPGTSSTVIIPGVEGWKSIGIDLLNGDEQELMTTYENGNLIINNFMIKDYPIAIRLSKNN